MTPSLPGLVGGMSPQLAQMIALSGLVTTRRSQFTLTQGKPLNVVGAYPTRYGLVMTNGGVGTILLQPHQIQPGTGVGVALNTTLTWWSISLDTDGPIVFEPWYAVSNDVGDILYVYETVFVG